MLGPQTAHLKSILAEVQSEMDNILGDKDKDKDRDKADKEDRKGRNNPGLQDSNTALASALAVVEGGDRTTPSQAIAVYKESSQQVKTRIAEWSRFKQTKLEQLNQQLREAKLAPIAIAEIKEQVEYLKSR